MYFRAKKNIQHSKVIKTINACASIVHKLRSSDPNSARNFCQSLQLYTCHTLCCTIADTLTDILYRISKLSQKIFLTTLLCFYAFLAYSLFCYTV